MQTGMVFGDDIINQFGSNREQAWQMIELQIAKSFFDVKFVAVSDNLCRYLGDIETFERRGFKLGSMRDIGNGIVVFKPAEAQNGV